MPSRPAHFYRLLSIMMSLGVLVAVLLWALAWRSDPIETQPASGQVEAIIDNSKRPVVLIRIGPEEQVRLFLPDTYPVPTVGETVKLVREDYADGDVRYRWGRGESVH